MGAAEEAGTAAARRQEGASPSAAAGGSGGGGKAAAARERFRGRARGIAELERVASASTALLMDAQGVGFFWGGAVPPGAAAGGCRKP